MGGIDYYSCLAGAGKVTGCLGSSDLEEVHTNIQAAGMGCPKPTPRLECRNHTLTLTESHFWDFCNSLAFNGLQTIFAQYELTVIVHFRKVLIINAF